MKKIKSVKSNCHRIQNWNIEWYFSDLGLFTTTLESYGYVIDELLALLPTMGENRRNYEENNNKGSIG